MSPQQQQQIMEPVQKPLMTPQQLRQQSCMYSVLTS
jgi:hypothetical protein